MKLGSETGSVVNHLYSRMTAGEPTPEVGMGATLLLWTDRRPATVLAWDGKVLSVQEDTAVRTDRNGLSEVQTYTYEANSAAPIRTFKKDANGTWCQVDRNPDTGRLRKVGGYGLRLGVREAYEDPSF